MTSREPGWPVLPTSRCTVRPKSPLGTRETRPPQPQAPGKGAAGRVGAGTRRREGAWPSRRQSPWTSRTDGVNERALDVDDLVQC